jgi:hypothetical protein
VGSAEALVVGLALWGLFAYLTLLLYWAVVGRGRATPLTSRLDGFILRMLSRGAAVTKAAGPPPRRSRGYRAGAVLVGAGMAVLSQWVAVSYLLGPSSSSSVRTAMAVELAACAVWVLVLITDFFRRSRA